MEWTHPIVDFSAILIESWRIGKRRIQAVKVPVLVAVVASDDGTLWTTVHALR